MMYTMNGIHHDEEVHKYSENIHRCYKAYFVLLCCLNLFSLSGEPDSEIWFSRSLFLFFCLFVLFCGFFFCLFCFVDSAPVSSFHATESVPPCYYLCFKCHDLYILAKTAGIQHHCTADPVLLVRLVSLYRKKAKHKQTLL